MSSDESSASSDGTATPPQASAPAGHLAVPRQKGEWELAEFSRSAQFPAVADRASVARPGRHNKGSGPALTRSLSRSMPVLGDSGDDLSAEIRTYRQALRSGRRINSPAEDSTTPRASSPSSPYGAYLGVGSGQVGDGGGCGQEGFGADNFRNPCADRIAQSTA